MANYDAANSANKQYRGGFADMAEHIISHAQMPVSTDQGSGAEQLVGLLNDPARGHLSN